MISPDRREAIAAYLKSWGILVLFLVLVSTLWTCSTKNLLGTDSTGSVFVNSNPAGADIIVDQTLTGKKTPDTVFDIAVGDHTISVSRSGYMVSPDSVVIMVSEDQTDTIEFTLLESDKGSLKVSSNAAGATICIDNQPTAEVTPHVFFNSIPVGPHIISIFKEGYSNENPAKEILDVVTGDTAEVDFALEPATVGKEEGNITPDFRLQDDYGFWRQFYAYRGFVTIVFFWASDCVPCMEEMPHLQEIYAEYEADTLIIFGINYGGDFGQEGFEVIRRVRDEEEITFTFLKGVGTSVRGDYEVTETPVTIILDREGKIYYYQVAFVDWYVPAKLREKLDELFGR
ncbi:MAG: PEGA domain-containing protein [Candidatus Zixiibacteriota bacterium]